LAEEEPPSVGREDVGPSSILVLVPALERPELGTLERLEHEYSLRNELDREWAVRPIGLNHHWDRTVLILEDPGGVTLDDLLGDRSAARQKPRPTDPGGKPLDQSLGQPMELSRFLRLAIGLAAGLSKLHSRGLIHKDIKPANILADPVTNKIWFTGFGITSRLAREWQVAELPEIIGGTPAYMSPEQTGCMNRSIDCRSDLYSLGVTLYQMLTGRLPFTASDPMEWVHCHIAQQPSNPSEQRPEVSEAISAIVLKLLSKTVEERYQTAAGLEFDLRKCLLEWESTGRVERFPIGQNDIPDRLLIPENLYGRTLEREKLLDAFRRVASTGKPELVLVSGYSGIGKSSVVHELHKVVLPNGFFVSGKFDQNKQDVPYVTLAQAFQTLIRQILSKSQEELNYWHDALLEALGPNAQLMVNLIAELELVIGKQPPVPELLPLEAQNRFEAVLRRFLGVFARKEHPLVLFLDDLQWLDPATLKLLEQFTIDPDIEHLLLIGAYRDNEVTGTHPLMLTLKAIREAGVTVEEIVLKPLSLEDVNQLLADALHCQPAHTRRLAALVHKKTGGNPFFTLQFLSTLADEQLLAYEPQESAWRWNVKRIQALSFTDSVTDLMIAKLRRLPAATQEALKQFACLGHDVDVTMLSTVRGESAENVHKELWEAVREGLIQRSGTSYKFLHDRIQDAVYLLIPEQLRAQFHLTLGRLLMARMTPERIAEQIFDIVNQLNFDLALISDPAEREQVAELNLIAGRKAKASTAYASACVYLSAGMVLVGPDGWEHHYRLAFDSWRERAECEYLNGDFEKAEELILELLCKAASKIDKATAYRLQILVQMMRAEYSQAIKTGLKCLRLFGFSMPSHPTRYQVRAEYEKVWLNLGSRSIESLVELPQMTDPDNRAAMQVLSVLTAPAFFTDSNLFYFVVYKMANASLKYGTTDASVHGYADLGLILGPVFHRYSEGYRFAQLACSLVQKYGFHTYKARAYYNMEQVGLWTQPVRTAIDFIRLAFNTCIETHDLAYACYCCNHLVSDLLLQGVHLEEVWREAQKGGEFVRKIKYRDVADVIVSQQRFILCLRGRTANFSTFSDAEFDETSFENQLTDGRMPNMVCWYWILKLQARFLSGDYDAANRAAEKAQALLWSTEAFIESANYYFYRALMIAALIDAPNQGSDTPPLQPSLPSANTSARRAMGLERQTEGIKTVKEHLERLREWSESCPETFRDKYTLVSAEVARMEGRELDAMRLYEQATRAARENRFVQNEGIANELAARFYAARGFDTIAHMYLVNARHCYFRWGANGKVRQLEQLHPSLQEDLAPRQTSLVATPAQHLDLAAVIKVSQAISGEIILEKLINQLMRIALEQAGAERGLLILARGNEQRIEAGEALLHQGLMAQAVSERGKITVHFSSSLVSAHDTSVYQLPESLLRYVVRTRKSVTLADATVQNLFSQDEYIERNRPRSVFCLPLIRQGKLTGILYLENNLTPGVFTPNRLATFELIASQAAISLEQARLYAELARANEDLQTEIGERRWAEAALKKSEQQLQDIIDHTSALVTVKDLDLHYLLVNREHERVYAHRYQIRGKTDYDFLPGEVAETIRANDRLVIETGKPIQFELTIPMAHGERHYVVVKFPLRDGTGKPYAVCGISTDITERKRAEEQQREAQTELAHVTRVATLGELTGSIAHEVKQPLTAIINNADACLALLPAEVSQLQEVREALSDIIADADRASSVIERIRGLIKKSPPQKSRLDLNETIGGAIALARGELDRNGVLLRTNLANDLPFIMGDRIQLQQVILNLIINGIEAMSGVSDGSRELWVSSEKLAAVPGELREFEAERQAPNAPAAAGLNEYILVSVADSGPGLDLNNLGRLFDAFYTTKPQGLGMGLSISRSIIEAHGGRLWAKANVPKGALFQFTLPVCGKQRAVSSEQ
jgi:PAS domain S-box-containing protein